MKSLKQLVLSAVMLGAIAPVFAQGTDAMTEGEVRKVDTENHKITLKHGEIKNLDMPAMTMVFQVADPKMLDKLKAGDKVRFKAAQPDGKLTVTEIKPLK
jgi:Cu(I)/Ag(I) efflux system protein CusF